jgi:hypothetical protein
MHVAADFRGKLPRRTASLKISHLPK